MYLKRAPREFDSFDIDDRVSEGDAIERAADEPVAGKTVSSLVIAQELDDVTSGAGGW